MTFKVQNPTALTPRLRQTLELVTGGLQCKHKIAERLGIKHNSVQQLLCRLAQLGLVVAGSGSRSLWTLPGQQAKKEHVPRRRATVDDVYQAVVSGLRHRDAIAKHLSVSASVTVKLLCQLRQEGRVVAAQGSRSHWTLPTPVSTPRSASLGLNWRAPRIANSDPA